MSSSQTVIRTGPKGSRPGLRPMTAHELIGLSIPPRQMALRPVLPLPGLAMLYGPRGMGKTYLALCIAHAIAAGGGVLRWHAPAPRRVLYIDGEMPAGALQDRLARIIAGAACRLAAEDALTVLASDLMEGGMPSLTRPEVQSAVEEAASATEVLIIDNLSTLAGGLRENEADDWEEFQRWLLSLRRRGKLVLFVHHAGKGGQQRGTSRREDVLDTVIALRRPRDYAPTQGARAEVWIEKARGGLGEALEPFLAALGPAGDGGVGWTATSLADEQARLVEAMLRDGMSIREAARELGWSKSKVQRIRQRLEA